ncbi:TlpA disulfide reductase family protein [Thermocrinis sp.]
MRRMWAVSLALGALLAFLLTYSILQERKEVEVQIQEQLTNIPDLTFVKVDGQEIKLSDYRGKVLLLNFWAVWCPPCKEELPIFEKAYKKYKHLGFEVIAVNTDTSERAMKEFLKENNYSFTFVRPKDDIEKQLKLFGLPTSYLIDRDGSVKKVKMGVYRELEKDLSEVFK